MEKREGTGRGGARKGAGRKKEDRVSVCVTLATATRDTLREAAARGDTTPGRIIDTLVKNHIGCPL